MNIIKELLNSSNGQFMTVTFTKKNGELRTINGRSGVTKFLAGGTKTVDSNKYFTIYENNVGYRNINYDTVSEVKIGGKVITVAGK
jgi:hypothetical protein